MDRSQAAPRVFVSHSHLDNDFTSRLVNDLRGVGVDVWLDIVEVNRGDFIERINEALSSRDWFILVLTPNSLRSKWVRLEVNSAINRVVQGLMHAVIPILAQPCRSEDIPATWAILHYYDATRSYSTALAGLLRALGVQTAEGSVQQHDNSTGLAAISSQRSEVSAPEVLLERLKDLGFTRRNTDNGEIMLPPVCRVPAGDFLMGTDPRHDKIGDDDEQPQHHVTLPGYYIAKYPVTVAEYRYFVSAGGPEPMSGEGSELVDWQGQLERLDHPVVCITYQEALDYADWLATLTGDAWRLPTEAEWEKAARWDVEHKWARIFPWGDKFDKARCNTSVSGIRATVPIGSYANAASPYGVMDMAGNVWEWTISMPAEYPYVVGDGRDHRYSTGRSRVIRGGSWAVSPRNARSAFREIVDPNFVHGGAGSRLILASDDG